MTHSEYGHDRRFSLAIFVKLQFCPLGSALDLNFNDIDVVLLDKELEQHENGDLSLTSECIGCFCLSFIILVSYDFCVICEAC